MKQLLLLLCVVAAMSCDKGPTDNHTNLQSSVADPILAPGTASWHITTNMPATIYAVYGVCPNKTDTTPTYGPTTDYTMTLTGLQLGTLYCVTFWAEVPGQKHFETRQFQAETLMVVVSPKPATILVGGTQRFTALPSATITDSTTNWTSTIGSIDANGLLTNLPAPATGTVKGCLRAYPTVCDPVAVTVTTGITNVTVQPNPVTVTVGGNQQFTTQVTGLNPNHAVVWGASKGTVNSNGLYTAPGTALTDTVTATSAADPTKSGLSVVLVQPRIHTIAFLRIEDDSTAIRCAGTACEEIFTMNAADGSNQHRITTTPWFQDGEPTWCGENKLVFARSQNGNVEALFVANPDGSNPQKINLGLVNALEPSCSPDGQSIAFYYTDDDQAFHSLDGGIATVHLDGTGLLRLTMTISNSCYDRYPSWSPNGQWIAFSRCDGYVYKMDPTGAQLTKLIAGGQPVWSPDGSKLAFGAGVSGLAQLFVANADGSNPSQLTHDPVGAVDATWSPDSKYIAYAGGCCNIPTMDIYKVIADGSSPTVNLTNTPANAERMPAWQP